MLQADSPTNLFWLINNKAGKPTEMPTEAAQEEGATFTEFTLNV